MKCTSSHCTSPKKSDWHKSICAELKEAAENVDKLERVKIDVKEKEEKKKRRKMKGMKAIKRWFGQESPDFHYLY